METEIVHKLTKNFEEFLHTSEDGVEFWLARDLQHLLGYGKWDNFQNVISKAKTACEVSGQNISDHFADVGKMVGRINSHFLHCTSKGIIEKELFDAIDKE